MRRNRPYRGSRKAPDNQRKFAARGGVPAPSASLLEFQARVAIAPDRKIPLAGPAAPLTLRVLDLLCPVGFGQRALILAPPRTGKTTFLKDLCHGVAAGAPEAVLYCLLVDERP